MTPKSATQTDTGRCIQVAALPWRVGDDGRLRVLMVTSRTNAKWMLPKGWRMSGKSDPEAALIEGQEEAGIDGIVAKVPVGSYRYIKLFDDGSTRPAQALIFPIRVTGEHAHWDEESQRMRKWFLPHKAAKVAFEPDLARFLEDVAVERILLF